MDSCNSGSPQSSSGGDDEYESRATFMSCGISQVNPNPSFFDPFIANYSTQQHDVISYPTTTPSITDSSSIPNINNNNATTANISYPFTPPSHPQPVTAPPPQTRNPKKRPRASRRAPTTVLTTDTANFRAMVQEFTGIPAPPFSNMMTSSFARNRLDLFASSIDVPSYLRSSFPQRVQSSPVSPFLGGLLHNNDNILVGSNSAASSSSQSFNNLLCSAVVDEQSPFLGSTNFNHQKIDSFGLNSNQQINGVSNNASATFNYGLQNLIIPSSPSPSNNLSNLLTSNQENADDYDRITGKNMANHPSFSAGSKLNVEREETGE